MKKANVDIMGLVRIECKFLIFENYEYNVVAIIFPDGTNKVDIAENSADGRARGISRFEISEEELLRRHGRDIRPEILTFLRSQENKSPISTKLTEKKVLPAAYYVLSLFSLAGAFITTLIPLAVAFLLLAVISFFLGIALSSGVWVYKEIN